MAEVRGGRGKGSEGGVVIKDNRKGPCGDGLALYLDTSYTCDRVVQTKLTHTHTHTHTHTDMSTGKIGKSDKLRGCSNINIMAVIL